MTIEHTRAAGGKEISALLGEPRLLAFVPLLYVAWADGDLDDEEIRLLRARVAGCEGLEPRLLAALSRWLDPDDPPSAQSLQALLAAARTACQRLTAKQKLNLSDLGLEIARSGGQELEPAECAALRALEDALGVATAEASRRILPVERPAAAPRVPPPAFRVAAMTRLLDGDERETHERLRDLLGRPEFRREPGLGRDAYRARVLARCRVLAAEGIGALSYPPACGGGGDYGRFLAAFESLAYGDLSLLVKFCVQFGLFGGTIFQLGTRAHHERYLRDVGSLKLPGCFAMTETGHGSNVRDLETVASYDPAAGEFVIRTPHEGARKDYIGNAARDGRLAVVFAQLETGGERHGVHAFLVPIREARGRPAPGVRIEDCGEKMGLNGVDNGRLAFDGVRVPRENLLDRFGRVAPDGTYTSPIASASRRFFTMLGTLVGGRVSIALAALSASKSALTIALRYGSRRRQFGPEGEPETAILDYLTVQRRLLPRLAATYALDFALKHLVRRFLDSEAEDRREVEGLAAGLKAAASWHATETIQACREACGGQGYLAENRFADLKADTDVFATFEGDNTVLLQLLGKSLLTGYRKQFGEMSLLGLVRFLAARAATAIGELNPVVTRLTDEGHLRDRDFLLAALRWREGRLLASLARRLKRRMDEGMDSFAAVNECQDHLLEAARAHVDALVAQRFAEGIDACDEPDLRTMLDLLFDLFALWRIEGERGWYLEQGYLEAGKAKAIRALINKLCGEARRHAVPLVDAFGIPDAVLAAPIAVRSVGEAPL